MNNTLAIDAQNSRRLHIWQLRWFSWPAVLVFILLPGVILLRVGFEHLAGSLLAYVNCVVIVSAVIYMLKRDPLLGLLPAISFIRLFFGMSGSALYFAIMKMEPEYGTLIRGHFVPFLSGFVKEQLVVALFLVIFIPLLLVFFNIWKEQTGPPVSYPRRLTKLIFILCTILMVAFDTGMLLQMGWPGGGFNVQWWLFGLFRYNIGLMIILGALFAFISIRGKCLLAAIFAIHAFVFVVGSMREYGFIPIFFFFVGLFFLSSIAGKKKLITLIVLLAGFSLYMLMGQATRRYGWGMGGFKARLSHMTDVRTYGELPGPVNQTMGRLFMGGGHSIITRTPEEVPYLDFKPAQYVFEMGESLLPGIASYHPYYRGNHHLLRYDLNVVTSSIEISVLGHFWMLGGWFAMAAGAIYAALLQLWILWLIGRARRVSWSKALIYLGVLGSAAYVFWVDDPIFPIHAIAWRWAMAAIVWAVVRRMVPQVVDENYFDEADELGHYTEGMAG